MELIFRHDHSGLTAEECGALAGCRPATWRGMVARRQAPRPSGFDSETGRRVWDAAEVLRWQAARPGRGNYDRRRKLPPGRPWGKSIPQEAVSIESLCARAAG